MKSTAVPGRFARTEAQRAHPAAADGMRVLAVGIVGWYHIWQQSWVGGGRLDFIVRTGAVWVDMMILLSAFCLYLPYANARAAHLPEPDASPLRFWKKRAVRILPSYYFNLAAALCVAVAAKGIPAHFAQDLAAHLTLTQTLFRWPYFYTSLNGVTWTVSVLAQFYLLFPLLVRGLRRAPAAVLGGMLLVQALWRRYALSHSEDALYPMLFNQLPAFGSVLALGLAGAAAYAWLSRRPALAGFWPRLGFTALGIAGLRLVVWFQRQLSTARNMQLWQLENRTALGAAFLLALLGLALGLPLPGKRLWLFLSGLSYNFYLWHQLLALWMKYMLRIPAWTGNIPPNQTGDIVWMRQFNAQCWVLALGAAVLCTYLIEKPAARRLNRCGRHPQKVNV